jgi:hypothetical protein
VALRREAPFRPSLFGKFTPPKRRFWKDEQKMKSEALFKGVSTQFGPRSIEKCFENYPFQTKILEGGTKEEIRIFEALFKGVSTRFGLRIIEKSVENPDFIFCSSFQNLRLGSIKIRISSFVPPSKIFVWGA